MRRSAVVLFAFLLAAAPTRAHAQSAADVSVARTLAAEGIKLAKAGKCADAIDKLDRAEKLFHAPSTLARLGECHIDVGKLVLGTEELRKVVREPLASDAPKAFVNAKARAERVLEKTQPRIPYVKITLAPAGVKADTTLDGETLSPAAIGTEWPVDPGEHVLEASAGGYQKATSKVTLKEAEKREVTLTLVVDPNATLPSPAPTTKPLEPTQPPPPDEKHPSRLPVYVAFGIGAAGLAVGGVAGVVFLKDASDLSSSCPNKTCTTSHASDLSTTKTWGTVSTVGFAVGAAGIAAGLLLLVISPSASVTPSVGVGSTGISGRF